MVRNYDPVRVRRWITPKGEIIRISETSLDIIRQVSKVKYSILELNDWRGIQKLKKFRKTGIF